MVEETAQVLKVENDVVWVQAIQQSACGSCEAQKGCGHSLLAKVGQKEINIPVARNELDVKVGDQVIIAVAEQAILKSSLLMYGLPLGLMIVLAVIMSLLGFAEGQVVIGSFIALLAGFVLVSKQAKNLNIEQWHPKLMRVAKASQSEIPMCEIH